MRELSLNILDIAHNSIRADARNLEITVCADSVADSLLIKLTDDGKGMSAELLSKVLDPFATTRTTRSVGMGLPLFKEAAETAGGSLEIESEPGKGTTVTAKFKLSHIDRMPLGDLADSVTAVIMAAPELNLNVRYIADGRECFFSVSEIKQTLDGVPITEPEIIEYIKDYLSQEFETTNGGLII